MIQVQLILDIYGELSSLQPYLIVVVPKAAGINSLLYQPPGSLLLLGHKLCSADAEMEEMYQ